MIFSLKAGRLLVLRNLLSNMWRNMKIFHLTEHLFWHIIIYIVENGRR